MKFINLSIAVLAASTLASCGSNPVRISADDIPSWCNDVEQTGMFASAFTGKRLLACGSSTGNSISDSREEATIDAKKQILDQLIGRLVTKYSKERLVDNYKDFLSYSSFGYDIVEQEVFDVESGYQTFILISTEMDDLKGTSKALLKPRFKRSNENLVSDKIINKKN
jgi:hypothetical protein